MAECIYSATSRQVCCMWVGGGGAPSSLPVCLEAVLPFSALVPRAHGPPSVMQERACITYYNSQQATHGLRARGASTAQVHRTPLSRGRRPRSRPSAAGPRAGHARLLRRRLLLPPLPPRDLIAGIQARQEVLQVAKLLEAVQLPHAHRAQRLVAAKGLRGDMGCQGVRSMKPLLPARSTLACFFPDRVKLSAKPHTHPQGDVVEQDDAGAVPLGHADIHCAGDQDPVRRVHPLGARRQGAREGINHAAALTGVRRAARERPRQRAAIARVQAALFVVPSSPGHDCPQPLLVPACLVLPLSIGAARPPPGVEALGGGPCCRARPRTRG
jgi:hypothetical protein